VADRNNQQWLIFDVVLEGGKSMDIKRKVRSPGSQGNAASEVCDIIARAGDWQYGRGASANDIENESQEEDLAFGIPHETMDFDPPGQDKPQVAGGGKVVITN
jgi:hypothetical protein